MNERQIIKLLKDSLKAFREFDFKRYSDKMSQAREAIDAMDNPPELEGEFYLVLAPCENTALAMKSALEKAKAYLKAPSRVIPWGTPLLLDKFNPFGTLWQEEGKAEETAKYLEESEEIWIKLVGGGQGTSLLYLGWLRYYQGRLEDAKILAWKSYRLGEHHSQYMIQLCSAELIMLLIRHGYNNSNEALEFLRKVRAGNITEDKNCIQTAHIILCSVNLAIGVMTETPKWMKSGDFGAVACSDGAGWYMVEDKLSPWLFPMATVTRMQYLCFAGRFADAINLVSIARDVFHLDLPIMEIYFDFWLCNCYGTLGDKKRLNKSLRSMLDGCCLDGLWLIPGEDEPHKEEILILAKEYGDEAVHSINRIGRGMFETMKPIRDKYLRDNFLKGMTPQEFKIAQLIYSGASNAEVAESLNISVQTVKNHLRRVYEKLGISSRRDIVNALSGAGDDIYAVWTKAVESTPKKQDK